MISNNLRVLRAYVLGIAISLIVSLAIGALYKLSYLVPTIVTILITYCLLYCGLWKIGRQESEQKPAPPINGLVYTFFFFGVAMFFEIAVALCNLFNWQTLSGVFSRAGIVWFYPFAGFYDESTFLVITPIITAITVLWCLVSYYMGTKDISVLKAIKNRLD